MKKIAPILALLLAALLLVGAFPAPALAATGGEPTDTYCPSDRNDHRHFFTEDHRTRPSCSRSGAIVYKCVYCHYEKTEAIAPLGHSWGEWQVLTEPTCTEPGTRERTCARCGEVQQKESDPLGHDWGDWYQVKPAALDAAGVEERACVRCGDTEQGVLPALVEYEDYALSLSMPEQYFATMPYSWIRHSEEGDLPTDIYDLTVTNIGNNATMVAYFTDYAPDVLHDVVPPIYLSPGESSTDGAMIFYDEDDLDTSTADPAKGIVGTLEYYFCVYGLNADGEIACKSNTVRYSIVILDDSLPTDWQAPDEDSLSLRKSSTSVSSDPNGYRLGETVSYLLEISNGGETDIEDIRVFDPVLCGTLPLCTIDSLAAGASFTYKYTYQVTLDDVKAHKIENIAYAQWGDQDYGTFHSVASNPVVVPTINRADVLLTKAEISVPANGAFYEAGEEVVFQLYVKNLSAEHVRELNVYDTPILDGAPVTTIDDLGPGEEGVYEVRYTITEADVALGAFVNIAWAMGVDENDVPVYAFSNEVEVPTGSDAFGVIWDLALYKEEVSTPTNGLHYVEGETIDYIITATNCGEVPIVVGYVYDQLKKGDFGQIGSFTDLMPSESITFPFQYTVTAENVQYGNVVNYAYAYWFIDGGEDADFYESESNEVWSKAGPNTPSLIPPVTWHKGEGDDYCLRTLLAEDGSSATYSLHLCGEHDALADELAALMEEAESAGEDALSAAWKMARTRWGEALEGMYEAVLINADADTHAAATTERQAFYTFLEGQENLLRGLGYTELSVDRTVAELLMERCADLCYDLHRAGASRSDSAFARHTTLDEATDYPACESAVLEVGVAEATYMERFCTDHRQVLTAVKALLQQADSPTALTNAWKRAQKLWQVQLDALVNDAYKAADAAGKKLIAGERVAFDRLVAARAAYLEGLYAPATAAELIAHLYASELLAACARSR